ncbi:FAD-dependent oxidoreductase [Rhodobacteraceae bacterium HSP-20]|uniref:FAD-dependent oxidoreductase n=1 Tax=Paragemmobacter amnigenus TaxID=2852097 RepID=A0ABS6J0R8_9RHOB|nr:FAD-dependent oxidoreductase [Rhodobacter amnigenus]MBU9697117.1 FAD-dependent oxidoreductase [Rhodobacter amnigenus]MBV4388344.1 FAD-dependent oxidoreductase [Rhodobacter amnigenus]
MAGTDICVIGAGSGGLSLAAGAVQMGAQVVLVEGAEMGGDCLNTGCVPSKALIAAAEAAAAMRGAGRFGIGAVEPAVDFGAVKDHVAGVIATIAPVDSQARFEGLGVRVIRGWARFVSPHEVEVAGERIRARRFVIATGSHAMVPDVPGLAAVPYLTNETVFALRERPEHLVILGGGPIGMEMAQAHRRLGCAVTVVEAARALGREDAEAAAVVLARLRAEGVDIREGAAAVRLRVPAGGGVEIVLADGQVVTGSHLLVAVGRLPALERLDLAAGGVAFDRRGVTVGRGLRSVSNRRVYAIGDAAGGAQFTHVAAYHAGIVIRQAVLGLPARLRDDHIPRVTYTAPELAQVGPTEAEARATWGARLVVARAGFDHNDRAQAMGEAEGFAKLMVVRGRVVGATVAGPRAGEVIAPLALAVSARMKVSALAGMVLPYPTLAEVAKRAAGAYFSPKLFDNAGLKRVVRFVERMIP